ncbi:sulfite exporter TauE/SafE family protein [uncultured Oscillibacter sp.]|uniref:sulfite exporter TauE/SafE family protein n=1 Tax=uncultured Oscillibacter sp. TaxID=876091 RepID=UPI001F99B46D|nr:sulfite exporter TauE/SafE family protein [uncultured Oscillibacter sp.]HJB76184.1 sulfite exporter TauE/SafE family protein [Candidatus Oscillibacter avistercoris]
MLDSVLSLFTEVTLDGFPLWVVLLICAGVFLASFMDAIAGGGGIISVPVYLMAFSGLPTYYVLGTNKLSAGIGTIFSTGRFIRHGYVHWRLFLPAAGLAVLGSVCGTQLQLRTPDVVLKYLLLAVLPVVAFFTLRTKTWPEEPAPISPRRQALIVWTAALVIGAYDGYYGPGTGTFLMLIFIRLANMDTRHAAGGVKIINLASNLGSLCSALLAGTVVVGVGLVSAAASTLGHYLGAGLAIKNGSRIVRPTVILVLVLLLVKVVSELLFPEFWS